jgi:hypothetical protein
LRSTDNKKEAEEHRNQPEMEGKKQEAVKGNFKFEF